MSNYVPDRVIARRLREYDPNLFLHWDVFRERWVLYTKHADGVPRHIAVIQNPDGSFRPADDRIIAQVYAADVLRRHGSAQELMRVIDKHNRQLDQAQKAIYADHLREGAKDLVRAMYGGGHVVAGIDLAGAPA